MSAMAPDLRKCSIYSRKVNPQEPQFIGMDFVMKDGGVSVKIDLKNLLKIITGSAQTSCANSVLNVKEDIEKLTEESK